MISRNYPWIFMYGGLSFHFELVWRRTSIPCYTKMDGWCQSSFGTDKNFIPSYLSDFYAPLFELIDPPRNFLEIGIARGARLLFWQKALPNAFLFAIENNISEAMHPDFKLLLGNLIPLNSHDFVIDDGPHTFSSQIEALTFIDILIPNWILLIEDVPHEAKHYSTLKSMIPNKDMCHLRAISFSHLSGRFDDSLIVFSRNAKIADWVEKEFSRKNIAMQRINSRA